MCDAEWTIPRNFNKHRELENTSVTNNINGTEQRTEETEEMIANRNRKQVRINQKPWQHTRNENPGNWWQGRRNRTRYRRRLYWKRFQDHWEARQSSRIERYFYYYMFIIIVLASDGPSEEVKLLKHVLQMNITAKKRTGFSWHFRSIPFKLHLLPI